MQEPTDDYKEFDSLGIYRTQRQQRWVEPFTIPVAGGWVTKLEES